MCIGTRENDIKLYKKQKEQNQVLHSTHSEAIKRNWIELPATHAPNCCAKGEMLQEHPCSISARWNVHIDKVTNELERHTGCCVLKL